MATPEYTYTRTNEITLTAFGPANGALYAAEVTDSNGNIYLWVAEPQARADARGTYGGEWDDVAFRDAVHAVVTEMFVGPESEAPQDETFTLTFDPGRDQADEWEIVRR